MSDRKDLARVIKATATYYGRQLDIDVLSMMCDDLADLSIDRCIEAYTTYRRNPNNRTFPLPAQIREIVQPTVSADDNSRLVPARIIEAITKFGWANSQQARQYIGELGWAVVQARGGWLAVCELNRNDIGMFQAQARDLAKSLAASAAAGKFGEAPALPETSHKVLSLGAMVKGIE